MATYIVHVPVYYLPEVYYALPMCHGIYISCITRIIDITIPYMYVLQLDGGAVGGPPRVRGDPGGHRRSQVSDIHN